MSVLGQLSVLLSLFAAALSAVFYFRTASSRAGNLARPRLLLRLSVAAVGCASLFLLILLLRHDFSNGYVYSYSDTALPLRYLISSFYAGQEGSFLFWALCSALIALVLRASTRRHNNEAAVMAVFMTVQTVLLIFVAVKSPFRSIWSTFPDAPMTIPAEGRGLNPLLQNFWMVIHPPVLFLGFAAMAVPFSLAIAGLWKRSYSILTAQAFPWILGATTVLGLGIMLGAYWAYGVLGWGGYWGWDPVENSSLVPWLTGVALLHTLLAQLRTNRYLRTNFVLASVSFFLVIYSTFLTRSGILGNASVHAFTDPGAAIYWLLLATLALIAVSSAMLMFIRRAELRPEEPASPLLTRESSLGAGTIVLLLCAAVVTFGTTLPIFSTLRVEPSFYNATNLPLVIAMGLLIGVSLFMQWEMQDAATTLRRSLKAGAVALIAVLALAVLGVRDTGALALIAASFFTLAVNTEVGIGIARGNPMFLGGKLAHAGLALFFLGMIASGRFETRAHVALPLNQPRAVLDHVLTYKGSTPTADGKYQFHVQVTGDGESFLLSPVMFAGGEQGIMKNPDIEEFFTRDFYLSPLGLEPAQASAGSTMSGGAQTASLGGQGGPVQIARPEMLVVEASIKPFMSLLWSGMILMSIGFTLAVVKRSQEARWKS